MERKYQLTELKDNEYTFDTRLGLSYSMELKKSTASYLLTNGMIKYIDIFSFAIYDFNYPIESDYKIRNTILDFLMNYFSQIVNDEILFFINNEFENNTNSHRAKSRLKLFRKLFRIANRSNNEEYIFLTNEHFVLNHNEYKLDYIGIIIKTSSENYINIVKSFNKFCHENSY
ncbi:hypothetical protein [Tenacibaculum dicentrarchi]|uniref:hypothetical protein n=1 Tax=Tenacibaculum dicentrarchi TaxID=669041 RepID=UPI0023075A65|nr:hypothetical protein [Tenacibaculum dicentrarchi]